LVIIAVDAGFGILITELPTPSPSLVVGTYYGAGVDNSYGNTCFRYKKEKMA
jgi:hypothetical protein